MKIHHLLLASLFATPPVWAVNVNVFKDAPMTRLSKDEVPEYSKAIVKVLESTPDGVTVEWKAPKTPFTSKITPKDTTGSGDARCRSVTIEAEAVDRFQRGTYNLCKGKQGQWQFRNAGAKPAGK